MRIFGQKKAKTEREKKRVEKTGERKKRREGS